MCNAKINNMCTVERKSSCVISVSEPRQTWIEVSNHMDGIFVDLQPLLVLATFQDSWTLNLMRILSNDNC